MSHPVDVESMTQEQKEYYSGECVFCLEVVEPPYPDLCPGCKVVRCVKCRSFIPARHSNPPDFCHGCGTVMPEVEAHFTRVSGTACVYMEAEWTRRNKGRESDGNYTLGTGHVHKKEDGSIDWERTGVAVMKERIVEKPAEGIIANLPAGSMVKVTEHEDVRILSDEEVEALKKFREEHRKK